jgi:hypothetical protein
MAVLGTDGVAPVFNPDEVWKMWSINDVWQGIDNVGSNRYVPKLKDYVVNPDTFETWIVDALDPVTLKPTLRQIRPYGMAFDLSTDDVLFGVGPGPDSETYRAYLNDSVFPHTLCIDQRLKIHRHLCRMHLALSHQYRHDRVSAQYPDGCAQHGRCGSLLGRHVAKTTCRWG